MCLPQRLSAGKVRNTMEVLAQRLLRKAAQKIGGPELLAKHLGVSTSTLRKWLNGEDLPPAKVLHKAADIVLDDKT
jgi:transcriptional regulator with XRE-family HTH domain